MEDIKFRAFSNADKFQILRLLNQELGENRYFNWRRDEAFWEWKYENNIFGKTSILVAEADDKVIATNAYWPWRFVSRGNKINAVHSCDTVLDRQFQGRGIFTQMMRYRVMDSIDNEIQFIYNFPNNKAVYGFQKLGWHYLANIVWLMKPLKPFRLLRSLSNKHKADSVSVDQNHTLDTDLCFKLHQKNQKFDESIQADRSCEYFEWRFKKHPFFHYGMITVEIGNKQAAGIFTVYEKGDQREMVVVDVAGASACSKALFSKLVVAGKEYGANYITTVYNPFFMSSDLWKAGFIKIKRKNMVVLPLNPAYENKLTNYSNWQVSASLHDAT